jgi:hypothetical protein
VAGFNQFFLDNPDGTDSWRYGVGIDQKFAQSFFGGAELSKREMDVPFENALTSSDDMADWTQEMARAYFYWTPHRWLALSAEYQFEWVKRSPSPAFGEEQIARAETHRVPLGIGFFHPSGITMAIKTTYVDQDGRFVTPLGDTAPGDDRFWVVDAFLGYRLPRRWGYVSIGVKNLFDQRFNFQDSDPRNPFISPGRLVLGKLTLEF